MEEKKPRTRYLLQMSSCLMDTIKSLSYTKVLTSWQKEKFLRWKALISRNQKKKVKMENEVQDGLNLNYRTLLSKPDDFHTIPMIVAEKKK